MEKPLNSAWTAFRLTLGRLACFSLVAAILSLVAPTENNAFAQSNSRFRDLSTQRTPSPELLFQKLADFQIKPTNLTPIYSELEKQGRDIFESLSPEQKAEAKMLAEQLLRNRGLDAPEVQSLMDRMGVDKEIQKQLAEQFRGSQFGGSQFGGNSSEPNSDRANRESQRVLEEAAKQLQGPPSNREDFKRALNGAPQAEDLDLDRLWEGDPGAKNGAKNLSQKQLLDLLDSLGASKNRPTSSGGDLPNSGNPNQGSDFGGSTPRPNTRPSAVPNSDSVINRPRDNQRESTPNGRSNSRPKLTLPKLQNESSLDDPDSLEKLFGNPDSDPKRDDSSTSPDRNPAADLTSESDSTAELDSTAKLLSQIDQLVKKDGLNSLEGTDSIKSDEPTSDDPRTRPDLGSLDRNRSNERQSSEDQRNTNLGSKSSNGSNGGSRLEENGNGAGMKSEDEVWAKEFYETAKKVLPRLKNDLDGSIDREQLRALKKILENQDREAGGPSFNDMLQRGTSMLANAQGNPALKEKIEARFDRMLVDVAKKSIENAEKTGSKNSLEKMLSSVFDQTIESAKDQIQDIKKKQREAKRDANNASRKIDSSLGDEDLSSLLKQVQDQAANSKQTNGSRTSSTERQNASVSSNPSTQLDDALGSITPPAVKLDELFTGNLFIAILLGLAFLGFGVWLFSWTQLESTDEAVRKKKLQQKLRSIRDPKDLVDAVDLYLLAHHGDEAAWWNAEHAKQEVEANRPQLRDGIAGLFNFYVLSRYSNQGDRIGASDRELAESTLTALARESQSKSADEVETPSGESSGETSGESSGDRLEA